jgi:hypothetical protein
MIGFLLLILGIVVLAAIVAMILSAFIRNKTLVVVASVVITQLLYLVWQYHAIANSYDPHMSEILPLPILLLIITLPVAALAATAVVFWLDRVRK